MSAIEQLPLPAPKAENAGATRPVTLATRQRCRTMFLIAK